MATSASPAAGPLLARLMRLDWRLLAAPLLVVMILMMLVVPLPTFVLDVLFTFNITLSLIILLVTLYLTRPLDFAAFPTAILLTTLLRLSLNVAAARVILLNGQNGGGAAGQVIESFGQFVVGGNYAVGIIIFAILVVINFVVITKGAGRIAEVSARFTLDAMPGKQMAIDADLNAGLIDQDEARRRRADIAQEADFFGAMDGASKFVRGDAVAAILILFIDLLGGLIIGVLMHGLSLSQAAQNYTLLSIGDALVAQIPSLVISIAAGIVISNVSTGQDVGLQLVGQLFRHKRVLGIAAGILGLIGLVPGMPHVSFLLAAAVLGGVLWQRERRERREAAAPAAAAAPATAASTEPEEVNWSQIEPVDTLALDVGYRLIALVDRTQGGELLARIRGVRRKFAQELGFLVAAVHIRDNLELRPGGYRIALKGVEIGAGEVFPDMLMAINPGQVSGNLQGQPTTDPAFGLPAVWIQPGQRDTALAMGYTVVDPSTVIATHLHHLLQSHAAELLGREEVEGLLSHLSERSPKLVEDLVPKLLSADRLRKVLQNLLAEGVPIRDMRTVAEVLAEHAQQITDTDELTARVRQALGSFIVQSLSGANRELAAAVLEPQLEQILLASLRADPAQAAVEPGLAQRLMDRAREMMQRMESQGASPVLLTVAPLRQFLARLLARSAPRLRVLSYAEVPDHKQVRITQTLGA
ncbi:MAG: flagellar biosynthesis protein FlhA [Betaproteobacteria bacterium]|nr:flagellar biosynthesis protein FlhA [Betaproteobacteria bacterium]MBU6513921.1 flagellar biosynthesis protein FlhA [Betaproteobacteria bacterium]MDE1956750.1 flagellar biosynthesis protein FlhA [Betaproteobacteria bacterium]MDE2154062.1 flagellar biosynthesis protein FlhA [Betaproteobacteria bacterium]MDE2480059.1 flagellar biosynthesis protein FlhA [Betaproteobacteria bacterium]